ncbi:MAG: hypothetical protein QXP27_08735 [Candidatus Methanomethyliaceae archaeon]
MRRIYLDQLLELMDRYRSEAERCLHSGCYIAGLVCVRAVLEAVLTARYTLELFDWTEEELSEYDFGVDHEQLRIDGPAMPHLKDLIDQAYKDRLITKVGRDAAHRIREWGNRIHPVTLTVRPEPPKIGRRNLQARLRDLDLVLHQLERTL